VTVQNRIFFTYLYLDNTTGMTHLKIAEELLVSEVNFMRNISGGVANAISINIRNHKQFTCQYFRLYQYLTKEQ